MSEFDDIDEEIDYDMGWSDGKRGKGRKKKGPGFRERLKERWYRLQPYWQPFATALRMVRRCVFFPIISPMGYAKRFNIHGDMVVVKRRWFWRIADGIITRLLLTPVILAIFFFIVVYATTHPAPVQASSSPGAFGCYFKRVSLASIDDQRLAGWYVPPLTVNEMAQDPEGSLLQKWPAVVVCHGLGASHDQYLSLTQTLHNAGFAVLMLDMRGEGSSGNAAVTYGLRERLDVLAGVKYLREQPNIDREKVCVVGHDIGAIAALQAAGLDSSLTAVVADGLWPKFDDRARNIFTRAFGAGAPRMDWMVPLYTAAFEIALRDRVSQIDTEVIAKSLRTQPVLFVARTGPNYAAIEDVVALASTVEAKHQVVVADEAGIASGEKGKSSLDTQIRDFLITATGWKGPNSHAVRQIEKLLQNRLD
ncbi:MAG: alpha/beta hydrolase [Phycisphaerae bacterium]